MKDTVVSIRMPRTLTNELRSLTTINHYVDLSEQIRDVLREKSIRKLKEYTIQEKEDEKTEKEKKIEELERILTELKNA